MVYHSVGTAEGHRPITLLLMSIQDLLLPVIQVLIPLEPHTVQLVIIGRSFQRVDISQAIIEAGCLLGDAVSVWSCKCPAPGYALDGLAGHNVGDASQLCSRQGAPVALDLPALSRQPVDGWVLKACHLCGSAIG